MMNPRLSRTQRIVLIIGLALALDAVGQWLMTIGTRGITGWVGYAPLSNQVAPYLGGGLHPWVRFVIWMVLIILWTGSAVLLLRERSSSQGDAPAP